MVEPTFQELLMDHRIEYTSTVPYAHQNPHIERSCRTTAGNVRACMLDKKIYPDGVSSGTFVRTICNMAGKV